MLILPRIPVTRRRLNNTVSAVVPADSSGRSRAGASLNHAPDGDSLMDDPDEHTLADLPPSAKLVFVVLEHEGPLTQKRLVEETRLSSRTVRYALGRLNEINAVSEQISFIDARQTLYTPTCSTTASESS